MSPQERQDSLLVPCVSHTSTCRCTLIHRAAGGPDSAMPGQAVSPQAVDTAPTDQIKRTQLRRPDTGSLSTQLSRLTHTHTHSHAPSSSLSPFSRLLSDTLHTSAGRKVANYHLSTLLPGQTIQLSCPPPLLIKTALCHIN